MRPQPMRPKVLTSYNDESLDQVLDALEKMSHHLTAAVVSIASCGQLRSDPRTPDQISE